LAPPNWGAAIKGKVAISLASGFSCVATSMAGEDAELVPEKELLVANEPCDIAESTTRVYMDDALWLGYSDAWIDAARRRFSFEANRSRMGKLH
jgi:hypothetical protein